MATLRNKRKLAAVTRETQEESPTNGQSRNTSVPRFNEDYITQVSEEIEGSVSKKLSQEFSRTESRILGALTKLDEFLPNQQIHTHFETVPGTIRNTNGENQGTNEDDSQSDPHPEAGIFRGQTTQNLGPKDCRDMVTGEVRHCRDMVTGATGEIRHCRDMVTRGTEEIRHCRDMVTGDTEEIRHCRDMVTGATEEIRHCREMVTGATEEIRHCRDMVTGATEENRNGHDMVTAVQEEIPYCSSGSSSGKQKKARSISQPQFRNEKPLRHLKETRFCWPSSLWRRAVFLPMPITLVTESRNCLNPSRQQCPHLMEIQRNFNFLKIYSKRN